MSKETALHLNTQTLIGFTEVRGKAWHYRAELQGAESNHYDGAIPVGDVERRLFHWNAIKVPVQAIVPADFETMTSMDANGNPVRAVDLPRRVAILRDDTLAGLGMFMDTFEIHQYKEWLIGHLSNLLGDTLAISSAGLLRGGAQAWVEISAPQTLHDDRSGFDYRPNILAATSLDGSLSSTFGRTITATVCDNTMSAALGEMGDQKVKIRHSRYSGLRIGEAREAMGLIQETQEQFEKQLRDLTSTTVTDAAFFKFLDMWQAVPEKDGPGKTKAVTKRDKLVNMYRNDMRVAPWAGTAFGVVQAVNTFTHHEQEVRGGSRTDRNMERAITGKVDKLDVDTLGTLHKALASV